MSVILGVIDIVVKFLIRDSFLALWICLVAIDLTDLKQNSVTGDADSLWFFVRELQYRGTERSQCVLWRWPTCEMVTFYVTIILGCCLCRYCVQYILYTKRKLLFPADLVSLWTLNLIPLWSVVSSCSAIWAHAEDESVTTVCKVNSNCIGWKKDRLILAVCVIRHADTSWHCV